MMLRKHSKDNIFKTLSGKVLKAIFVFFVAIIFIQTYTNIIRDKDIRLSRFIGEKEKLTRLAAASLESELYRVTSTHQKEVIGALGDMDDTEFCRYVSNNGAILMSTNREEIDKVLNHPAVKTNKVITFNEKWTKRVKGKNPNIKVVVAPTKNGSTLWLGYNVDKIFSQISAIIFEHIKIAFIIVLVLIVYILSVSERFNKDDDKILIGDQFEADETAYDNQLFAEENNALINFFIDIKTASNSAVLINELICAVELSSQKISDKLRIVSRKLSEQTETILKLKSYVDNLDESLNKSSEENSLAKASGNNIEKLKETVSRIDKNLKFTLLRANSINCITEMLEKLTENIQSFNITFNSMHLSIEQMRDHKDGMTRVINSIAQEYKKFAHDNEGKFDYRHLKSIEDLYKKMHELNSVAEDLKKEIINFNSDKQKLELSS